MSSAYETQDEESTQVRRHTETDAPAPDDIVTSKVLETAATSDADDDFASNTMGGNSITHHHRTKLMLFLNSIKNLSYMSAAETSSNEYSDSKPNGTKFDLEVRIADDATSDDQKIFSQSFQLRKQNADVTLDAEIPLNQMHGRVQIDVYQLPRGVNSIAARAMLSLSSFATVALSNGNATVDINLHAIGDPSTSQNGAMNKHKKRFLRMISFGAYSSKKKAKGDGFGTSAEHFPSINITFQALRRSMRFRRTTSMDLRDFSPRSTRMSSQISNHDENSINRAKSSVSEMIEEYSTKNKDGESKLSDRAPESPLKPNSSQASASLQNSPLNEVASSEIETPPNGETREKRKEKEPVEAKRAKKLSRSKLSAGKQVSAISRTDSVAGAHDDKKIPRSSRSSDHVKTSGNRHESPSVTKKLKVEAKAKTLDSKKKKPEDVAKKTPGSPALFKRIEKWLDDASQHVPDEPVHPVAEEETMVNKQIEDSQTHDEHVEDGEILEEKAVDENVLFEAEREEEKEQGEEETYKKNEKDRMSAVEEVEVVYGHKRDDVEEDHDVSAKFSIVDELQDLTNDDFKYIGEYDGQESTDYTTWDSRAQGGKKKLRKIDLDPFRLFQQDDPNDSADEESMNVTKQNTLVIEELSDTDDAQTKAPTSLALDGGLSHYEYAADQQDRVEHHDKETPQASGAVHHQSLDSSPEASPLDLTQQSTEASHRIQIDSETSDGIQSREDSNHMVDANVETSNSQLHAENSNLDEGSSGSAPVEMKTPEPLYEGSCLDEQKEAEASSDQHGDSIESISRVHIRRVSGPDDWKEGDSLLLDNQGVIMAVSLSESQMDDDKEIDSLTSKPEHMHSDAVVENKDEDAEDLGIPLLVTVNGQVTAICYFKLADDTLDQSDTYPILSDSANKNRNQNYEENLRRKALYFQQRSSAHNSPSGQPVEKREEEDPISLNVDNIVEEKNVNAESKEEEIFTSADESVFEKREFDDNMNVPEAEQVKRPQGNGAAEIAIKTPSLDVERSGKGVLPETLTFTPAYEARSEQTSGVDRTNSHESALDQFGETWSSSSSSEKVQLERYEEAERGVNDTTNANETSSAFNSPEGNKLVNANPWNASDRDSQEGDGEWENADNSFRFSPHNPFSKQYHVMHKSSPIPVPGLSSRFNSAGNSQVSPFLNADSRSPVKVARKSTNPFEDLTSAEPEPAAETYVHRSANVFSNDPHEVVAAQEKGLKAGSDSGENSRPRSKDSVSGEEAIRNNASAGQKMELGEDKEKLKTMSRQMNTSALVAGGLVGLTAESFHIQSQRSRSISAISTAIDLESRSKEDRDALPDLERTTDFSMLETPDQSLRVSDLDQASKEIGCDSQLDSASAPSEGMTSVNSDATQRRLFDESEGDGLRENDQAGQRHPYAFDGRLASDDDGAPISSEDSGYPQLGSNRIGPDEDGMRREDEHRNGNAIPEMRQLHTRDSAVESVEDENKDLTRDTDSEMSKFLPGNKGGSAADKTFLKPPQEGKMMIKESVSLIDGIGQVRRIRRSFMGLLFKGLNQIEGIVSRRSHEVSEETTALRSLQQEPSTDTTITTLSIASRNQRHRSSSLRKKSIAAGTRGREALSKRQSEAWLQEIRGRVPRNVLHKVV